MLPASTFSPPNFFTRRRRPAESRPLRDEPPAFLCAIGFLLLRLYLLVFRLRRSLFRRGLPGGLLLFGFRRHFCRGLRRHLCCRSLLGLGRLGFRLDRFFLR